MTRLSVNTTKGFPSPQMVEDKLVVIEARLNGGMDVYVDPADLSNVRGTLFQNVEIRADKVFRRAGSDVISPAKPNSDPVLLYVAFKRFDGTTIYLRFTKNKLYKSGVSSWTEITSASAFSITNTTRIKFTTLNDRFFFSVGNKEIQEINFGSNTYAALGNAGKYKYITGFFNRVIGANKYDSSSPNPVLVGWSGDLNFGVWDTATDISAGSTPLVEAATDFADPITGLFGFASVMLMLRERSLWTATKRAVASNPFQFQASFPYAGCDTPNSATQKRNGIVWYDNRSNQVYDYTIGSNPREIGDAVRDLIRTRITDLDSVMGTYDTVRNRYHLLIPSSNSNQTYEYVFDYGTESWVETVRPLAASVSMLDGGSVAKTIDELSGTINSLVGYINDLSTTTLNPPKLFYGLSDGDIVSANSTTSTDNGTSFTSSIRSKVFSNQEGDLLVRRLLFKYLPLSAGTVTFYFSRDGGDTWETYETLTITSNDLNKRKIYLVTQNIRAPEFCFRIDMNTANIQLLEYRMDVLVSPLTKSN